MGGPCPDKTTESLYRVMTCGLSGNDGPLDLGEVMDPALDQLRHPDINKDDLKAIIEFSVTIPEPITVPLLSHWAFAPPPPTPPRSCR